jgi:hypothetical protein
VNDGQEVRAPPTARPDAPEIAEPDGLDDHRVLRGLTG